MQELRRRDVAEIDVIASSSILLDKYGKATQDLEADGFKVTRAIDCILMNDSHEAMAKTLGLSIIEHATALGTSKPDLMLVVGDRFDMLAPALTAKMLNTPIAHIQGGETSGTIDNTVRYLISHLSVMHFVATEKSRENLLKDGLPAHQVFNFGCPAVEYISSMDIGAEFETKRIKKRFKREIKIKPGVKYFVVMIHPDTVVDNDVDVDLILNAIEETGAPAFIFYPNADARNAQIVSAIARHNKNPNFYPIRHMPLDDFIHTLAHSACMVGNSSSGIREAASFGVPVINIGTRQDGRERNANTLDIGCSFNEIKAAIKEQFGRSFPKENIYYTKNCTGRMVDEISKFLNSPR
jgi:UDP-hydrolysing UDP-N-acetyl-D-glucosamine 2-epimerase